MDETPEILPPETPGASEPPPGPQGPVLSRPALWILLLFPVAFLPLWRVTFPHLGLWPAVALGCLAAVVLRRGAGFPDRGIAWAGLAAAGAAFAFGHVVSLAEGIPGDVPQLVFPQEAPEISWPARILSFAIILFSITLHEFSHAMAAYFSGDPTARERGRMTLNPVRHLDLFGSLILPLLMLLLPGGFVFGYAKPVPVDPSRFRNPRRGRLAVAVSGVGANLALALLSASLLATVGILLHLAHPAMTSSGFMNPWQPVTLSGLPHPGSWMFVVEGLKFGVIINMILFTLNILPIPPLDGFHLVEGMVSARLRPRLERLHAWGFLVFMVLLVTRALEYLLLPGAFIALFLNFLAGAIAKLA